MIEEMGIDPNEAKDVGTDKVTPLAIAIARGYFDLANYLYSKGCKVTADMFFLACAHSDQSVINFVIDKLKG